MNLHEYENDVNNYALEIIKYLISRGSTKEDAEDAVQDAIVKIIDLDILIEKRKLRSFMYRTSIRIYINDYRRRKNYHKLIQNIQNELVNSTLITDSVPILEVIKKLSQYEQNLLTLYYYDNYSTKQLSKHFQCSPSKIKIDLYRARKKMKDEFKKNDYDEWSL